MLLLYNVANVRTGNTGYGILIAPAGTTISSTGIADNSDPSLDRLCAGQNYTGQAEYFYYRVGASPASNTPASNPTTINNIPSKETMTVTVSEVNVREQPSASSNSVATYSIGTEINYDNVETSNGYIWVSYVASDSGLRRYVAAGVADGSQLYGTFKP